MRLIPYILVLAALVVACKQNVWAVAHIWVTLSQMVGAGGLLYLLLTDKKVMEE